MATRITRLFVLTAAAMVLDAQAQQRNANMLFQGNRLQFTDNSQLPTASALPMTGHASISDTNGQLKAALLWNQPTGQWWIADGGLVNQPGLPGEVSLSSSGWRRMVFLPKPGSPDSVYLFFINQYTTSPPHMNRLGMLAMSVGASSAPFGGIAPAVSWIATDIAHGFMVVPHANGEDYWVVVQPVGTNTFEAYRLGVEGADPVAITSEAGPVRAIDWQFSQWMPNTQGDRFVCTQRKSLGGISAPDTLETELFGFDLEEGTVTHLMTLPSRRAQGAEFSATGRYLYVLEHAPDWVNFSGVTVSLVQYDLEAADPAETRTLVHVYTVSGSINFTMRVQLLRGIDGRIYCTHEQPNPWIGVVMEPEEPAALCGYVHQGVQCPSNATGFFPPVKRYHDSPVIALGVPAAQNTPKPVVAPQPLLYSGWLSHPTLLGAVQLEWRDAAGLLARSEAVMGADGRARLDVTGLPAGTYVLRAHPKNAPAPVVVRVQVAP